MPVVTGQVQQDDCFAISPFARIRAIPHAGSLVPANSGSRSTESFPVEYLHEADPDRWPEARRQSGRALLSLRTGRS